MIGFSKDIFSTNKIVPPFLYFNFVDTAPVFDRARKNIRYFIPEFLKYISGDRSKSKIYGKIKKFYPEELIFMDKNIVEYADKDIKEIDIAIEDSCSIYSDLRVIIINDKYQLTSISGYDILSFTKGDKHINTVFIQIDKTTNMPTVFSLCLKLFDNIIINELSSLNVPIYTNNLIPLYVTADNSSQVAKFIVDYLYELIYPFYNSLTLKNNEIEGLLDNAHRFNFGVVSLNTFKDLYYLIKDTSKGLADYYNYIAFVIKVEEEVKSKCNIIFS